MLRRLAPWRFSILVVSDDASFVRVALQRAKNLSIISRQDDSPYSEGKECASTQDHRDHHAWSVSLPGRPTHPVVSPNPQVLRCRREDMSEVGTICDHTPLSK